jgi:hypothetical protein
MSVSPEQPAAPSRGSAERPYFKVPLNLPHAGRIARRIASLLSNETVDDAVVRTVVEIQALLEPSLELDDNPPFALAMEIRDRAAVLARRLVDQLEAAKVGHDRLGQCVRNLFECLELGPEGAEISLRAGENPKSLQRPY